MKKSSHEGGSKFTASALAGILAVGMVPAAAFAEDVVDDTTDEAAIEEAPEEAVEEAAIELEDTATAKDAFEAGAISAAKNGDSKDLSADELSSFTLTAESGKAIYLVPTKVTPLGGKAADAIDLTETPSNWEIKYYKDNKGEKGEAVATQTKATMVPGDYWVEIKNVESGGDLEDAVLLTKFTIKGLSLDGVFAYEGTDITDKEFAYTGSALTVAYAVGDEKINATDDYTAAVYKKDANGGWVSAVSVQDAGDYRVVLTGKQAYDKQTAGVLFAVAPIDLAKEGMVRLWLTTDSDAASAPSGVTAYAPTSSTELTMGAISVNKAAGSSDSNVELKLVSDPDGDKTFSATEYGKFTYEVVPTAAAAQAGNYIGKATVEYTRVQTALTAANFIYNSKTLPTTYEVNRSAATVNPDFNPDAVTVSAGTVGNLTPTYTIVDAEGKAKTKADLSKPGVYTVTFTATSADSTVGGSTSIVVTVKEGDIKPSGAFFTYDDETTTGIATGDGVFYTGEDLLANVKATVKEDTSKKELKEGSDYELVVRKLNTTTSKFEEADSMTDAGTYRIYVESDKYTVTDDGATPALSNVYLEVVVDKAKVAKIRLAGLRDGADTDSTPDGIADSKYVQYGDAFTPVIEYCTTEVDEEGDLVWRELPADTYTMAIAYNKADDAAAASITTKATEIKEKGAYKLTLTASTADPANGNFDVDANIIGADAALDYRTKVDANAGSKAADSIIFTVVDAASFVDVPAENNWAFDYIEDVNANGWMTGYKDGKHFGPKDNMKRGDVALVLYRMASGESTAKEGTYTTQYGNATPFSDVDGGMYYAEAIAWANQAGIVNGYTSGKNAGKFLPEANVSREEFVVMMARYAKYQNVSTKSDGAAMATKKDPAKVSSWAKDAVAWGVDEDMIGSNGTIDPQGKITREQIAKMVSVFAAAHEGAATPVE